MNNTGNEKFEKCYLKFQNMKILKNVNFTNNKKVNMGITKSS